MPEDHTEKPPVPVTFTAQKWVNDHALEVDPLGDTEWKIPYEEFIQITNGREPKDVESDTYDSDYLRFSKDAPQWIRDWDGPFYCEVDSSYFEDVPTPPGL